MPSLFLALPVGAANVLQFCNNSTAQSTDVCKSSQAPKNGANPVIGVIKAAIDIISILVGVASVIVIILSGLKLIIANGEANAIKTARSGIIYALLGLAITAVAQIIVAFVLDRI
ncbi:MAG TPA: hypothetical protein VNE40_02070 [Candidatus Dormibacteraeota bacterium]|nr:hypothetical protein [Candidatus Dormibacteraeota bacterium]